VLLFFAFFRPTSPPLSSLTSRLRMEEKRAVVSRAQAVGYESWNTHSFTTPALKFAYPRVCVVSTSVR
jgi:hypothetical protein